MDNRCTNCGEPALRTDNVCWHCGAALPWYDLDDPAAMQVKEGWQSQVPVSSLVLYSLIALAVLMLLLLVTNTLGRQPQVQISVSTRPPDEWEVITGKDTSYTFFLPLSWEWMDFSGMDNQQALQDILLQNQLILSGTFPLGSAVDDLQIISLATAPPVGRDLLPGFMVIATSSKLNRLSYEDARLYLEEGGFDLSELSYVDDFQRSHLSIVTEIDPTGEVGEHRCRQQFIRGSEEAMLVALCSPGSFYAAQQGIFAEILESFQRLS